MRQCRGASDRVSSCFLWLGPPAMSCLLQGISRQQVSGFQVLVWAGIFRESYDRLLEKLLNNNGGVRHNQMYPSRGVERATCWCNSALISFHCGGRGALGCSVDRPDARG